jgi:hypothetical protein
MQAGLFVLMQLTPCECLTKVLRSQIQKAVTSGLLSVGDTHTADTPRCAANNPPPHPTPSHPLPQVLEEAQRDLISWKGTGMSIMEMSHRGKEFDGVAKKAEADLRTLLAVPSNYKILFLQGGDTGLWVRL